LRIRPPFRPFGLRRLAAAFFSFGPVMDAIPIFQDKSGDKSPQSKGRRIPDGPFRHRADSRGAGSPFCPQQPSQNALLHVHPVAGLPDDGTLRAVDHLVGDFLAAMGRQAVQEKGVLGGLGH